MSDYMVSLSGATIWRSPVSSMNRRLPLLYG